MPMIGGFMWGTVTQNVDPMGIGRIRVSVAGLWEPEHEDWIPVVGWPGAGHPRRGSAFTIPIGAQVVLLFEHGDSDATPVALPGLYGAPDGVPAGPEILTEVFEEAGAEAVTNVEVIWEDEVLRCFFVHEDDANDEPSDRRFVLVDKRTGTNITLNATDGAQKKSGTITIHASTSVDIKSHGTIKIDGAQVQIQGRTVQRKPGVTTI